MGKVGWRSCALEAGSGHATDCGSCRVKHMRVEFSQKQSRLEFVFALEQGDQPAQVRGKKAFRLDRLSCHFDMPSDWHLADVHPDLLALACIHLVQPYTTRLVMPKGVSSKFAQLSKNLARITLNVDPTLEPRRIPERGRAALAFSGGTDSLAALRILPNDTVAVFLERVGQSEKAPKVSSAAVRACDALVAQGHCVVRVPTNMESMRKPIGVSWEWGWAVPLFLLSDHYGLDSVAFGTVAESAYRYGAAEFLEFTDRSIFNRSRILDGAGLSFNPVTAGISELGTAIIVEKAGWGALATSCAAYDDGNCGQCKKCFRMSLVTALVRGEPMPDEWLDRLFMNRTARDTMREVPMHHESVYSYVTSKYKGQHPLMNILKRRVRGDRCSFDWVPRWFPRSTAAIPPSYRERTRERILEFLEPMSETEIEEFVAWHPDTFVATKEYRETTQQLLGALAWSSSLERALLESDALRAENVKLRKKLRRALVVSTQKPAKS